MSRRGLARHAARRDENEPEIRKRFAYHGWHTEQVSGKGMPDLLVFACREVMDEHESLGTRAYGVRLVDVKMPKGTLKPAQVEKWTALRAKGIPVYVVRTVDDVDALVRGELGPWEPNESGRAVLATASADAGKRLRVVREPGKGQKRAPRPAYDAPPSPDNRKGREFYGRIGEPPFAVRVESSGYDPGNPPIPRSDTSAVVRALRAAQEAEATFAPAPTDRPVTHPQWCECPACTVGGPA